jgi:hypothetical protein
VNQHYKTSKYEMDSIPMDSFPTPNLPLLQTDQDTGIDWFICEDAVVTRSEKDDSSIDLDLWLDLRISSYSFNRVKSFFQPSSISYGLLV